MKTKAWTGFLSALLCLLLILPAAPAETRQAVIMLEGMKEVIEETTFESPQGFYFWYPESRLEAYNGTSGNMEGVVVTALYSDDSMILSMIPEEDALEYTEDLDGNIAEQSAGSRVQMDVYRDLEDGQYLFLTLIAENGLYLRAVGQYAQEAAEGNAKFFDRVLDSVAFLSAYDAQMLSELPGEWAEEYEGAGTVLTLEENRKMSLYCYGPGEEDAYTCEGTWSYESVPDASGRLRLLFTETDNPLYADSGYRVECVYTAYTESWVEDDTEYTCLILNPPISCSGVAPFEEVYGTNDASLYREKGPNMRVVKCKEYVSLREARSKSSKRLAKVPLGALVLAYPEAGEENGFILCVYHDETGYILAEYLQAVE